ncbi:MAG: DUF448 domain-containing protein [Deltaproteobacteria bacterium]|jgi:hypothetical protein|nr:DUF448 domain-containing protein [Deltaproteobacteria bacterium]
MALKGNTEAPQRSCLGCRTSKDKNLLIRFVQTPEMEIMPDLDSRLPGRGAYTCISKRCVAAAIEQRQFKRSFKHDVSVMPSEQLIEHIRQQLHDRIIGLIGLANKAGLVTSGGSMVLDALRGKAKPGLIIVATDVSEAIGGKIIYAAAAHHVPHRIGVTKDDFGAILGKAPRSAIAVASGGFVAQLVKAIDRYKNFLGEV